jgi:tetratricopeptide (TPR) repeat protein
MVFPKPTILLLATFLALPATFGQDAARRFQAARNLERAGEYERAEDVYRDLVEAAPNNDNYFYAWADALVRLKRYDEAIAALEARRARTPHNPTLAATLGKALYLKGEREQAEETWRAALDESWSDASAYRIVADAALAARDVDLAVEFLELGNERVGDGTLFAFDVGHLYYRTMKHRRAAEAYADILATNPNQVGAVVARMRGYLQDPDAMTAALETFETRRSESGELVWAQALAEFYLWGERYAKSLETRIAIDRQSQNGGHETFRLAEAALRQGAYETAAEAYRYVSTTYPDGPLAARSELGYARSLEESLRERERAGRETWKPIRPQAPPDDPEAYQTALEAYAGVAERYQGETALEAEYRSGLLRYRLGDDAKARAQLRACASSPIRSPFVAEAEIALGVAATRRGAFDEAEASFRKAANQPHDAPAKRATYLLARVRFYQGDVEGARATLDRLIRDPANDATNDALELANLLNSKMNDSTALAAIGEGEGATAREDYDAAREAFQRAATNERSLFAANYARLRLAELDAAQDRHRDAVEKLDRIVEEGDPLYGDYAALLAGDALRHGLGDDDEAAKRYRALLEQFPNSIYADDARENINEMRNKTI